MKKTDCYIPYITYTPGERTITNLLKTALSIVGTVNYVFGGGWDLKDGGSSEQTTKIGIPDEWIDFFNQSDSCYSYKTNNPQKHRFPKEAYNQHNFVGLDCSGYIGWVVYNTLNSVNDLPGYVMTSTKMASTLANKYSLGYFTKDVQCFKTGDIMSINGHVWLCVGKCADQSIVILHSTPSVSRLGYPGGGVQLSALGGDNCDAMQLVGYYMGRYYPKWYKRYDVICRDQSIYLSTVHELEGRFTWSDAVLSDPDRLTEMYADQILEMIFKKKV